MWCGLRHSRPANPAYRERVTVARGARLGGRTMAMTAPVNAASNASVNLACSVPDRRTHPVVAPETEQLVAALREEATRYVLPPISAACSATAMKPGSSRPLEANYHHADRPPPSPLRSAGPQIGTPR